MSPDDLVARYPLCGPMLALAVRLHDGQMDAAGRPKTAHIRRVAVRLVEMFPDATRDEVIAALLHDAIEDCGVSAAYLMERGAPLTAVRIVLALTHDKANVPYRNYIYGIAVAANLSVIRVKLADNADNASPDRPDYPGRRRAMAEKYVPARAILMAGLALAIERGAL